MSGHSRPLALLLAPEASVQPGSIRGRLSAVAAFRRRDRDRAYLEALARTQLGEDVEFGIIDPASAPGPQLEALGTEHRPAVALMWADAIGMRWTAVEREVLARAPRASTVRVITGRRRMFDVRSSHFSVLRSRRWMVSAWIPELLTALFMIVTAPALVVADAFRGRR